MNRRQALCSIAAATLAPAAMPHAQFMRPSPGAHECIKTLTNPSAQTWVVEFWQGNMLVKRYTPGEIHDGVGHGAHSVDLPKIDDPKTEWITMKAERI